MTMLNIAHKSYLRERFGDRVTFDRVERVLYSHDIAAMPAMISPLIGDTTPDAVVQPASETELVDLMQWAARRRIPLTPRGKASSGYGGAIPVRKGIVIDFYRLKDVVSVDAEGLKVTVQPGITWEQLDRRLLRENLTLRLYPTSYPSSTVGGWLAQGGAGIGSYEFGYFRDNVLSCRVVLPSGDVREVSGGDLDLVAGAEGITGCISSVTLSVMLREEMDVTAVACADAADLQKLVSSIIYAGLPIWSMVYINPRMAEMKNRAPLMELGGRHAEERVLLPAAYVLTMAYRMRDRRAVQATLRELVKPCEAEILSDRVARHEWDNRFKLMIVKRLGPSLVPAEVIVPLSSLGRVMTEIEQKVNQPVVKEGVIIRRGAGGRPESVILGFIPSNQRTLGYNFVFGLALTIMNIAEKNGGRSYATGLYFSKKADTILGKEQEARLRAAKSDLDPGGIMNPGKVIGGGLMGMALNLAAAFEPLIRPFGNAVITQVGERPEESIRGIPPEIAWYAYSCSQCGYCLDECDQFYGRGWESQSPRGKWYWLREYMEGRTNWDQRMVDTFLACTTCEKCNLRCSAALPIESSWMALRGKLVHEDKKMTFPPFEMMAAAVRSEGDIWAGYRRDRDAWFPRDLLERHGPDHESKNVYFAGCTASYVEKDIAMASVRLLDAAGVDFTYLGARESCCGTPMLVAGKWDVFTEVMKRNILAVKAAGSDTVITSCPACDMMWRHVYPDRMATLGLPYGISVHHYSEAVTGRVREGKFAFPSRDRGTVRVTWHDSCHIGRVSGVYDAPRELIKAVPHTDLVEMAFNRQNARCCGSVLTLIKDPPVAAEVGKIRLDEAVETGAEKVLALCPCCEFQLRIAARKKGVPVEVEDLARFAASALGYELPDPNPEVQAQWAVFEAMIALMTPRGFADLMDTMWPEMIEALPFGLGPVMRAMGRVPGALRAAKPLFPFLFPLLLPRMMPKVMAVMLERIADRIPMPGYMKEQMPAMMPQVMGNLMPHMIGDLVPLVTDPMIAYLTGKTGR